MKKLIQLISIVSIISCVQKTQQVQFIDIRDWKNSPNTNTDTTKYITKDVYSKPYSLDTIISNYHIKVKMTPRRDRFITFKLEKNIDNYYDNQIELEIFKNDIDYIKKRIDIESLNKIIDSSSIKESIIDNFTFEKIINDSIFYSFYVGHRRSSVYHYSITLLKNKKKHTAITYCIEY